MQLKDKEALITGGTSGIGAAIAKRFAAEGARVSITGLKQRPLPHTYPLFVSDAGDPDAARYLIKLVGPLDILVVNAGIAQRARIKDTTEESFDAQFRVNTRGPFFLLQAAAPIMRPGGSIILISSMCAVRGIPDLIAYGASKAALRSIGLGLSMELAPRNVRVNTITPAGIVTPLKHRAGPALTTQTPAPYPLNRLGTPEEVAAAALYLASDESAFVTGTELFIDGGISALGRV